MAFQKYAHQKDRNRSNLIMYKSRSFSWNQHLQLNQSSNGHISVNINFDSSKTTTKTSKLSRFFQQYTYQSNLINIKFKMLKNKLCTLVQGLGEKVLRKSQKLMNLLIRFQEIEPNCLSSHVSTSFYIKKSFI